MMPVKLKLDFARRRGRRFSPSGLLLLLIGCGVAYWTFTDYQDLEIQSQLLDLHLAKLRHNDPTIRKKDDPDYLAKLLAATRPLATPWTALLNDLESAAQDSGDDVALLEVAPDRTKRQVRIAAEARTLPAALDYVVRLQNTSTLVFPTLEKHEVLTNNRERPVRFEILAEWSLSQ
jgi:hypothetical protein